MEEVQESQGLMVPRSRGPKVPGSQGPIYLKLKFKYELDYKEGPSCFLCNHFNNIFKMTMMMMAMEPLINMTKMMMVMERMMMMISQEHQQQRQRAAMEVDHGELWCLDISLV